MSHGADVENIKRQFNIDHDLIDFSSNINPVVPPQLKRAIINGIDSIQSYPDIEYIDLREKIADSIRVLYQKSDISIHNICVGNGASELISLVFRMDVFDRVRVLAPLYSEHIRSSEIGGKGPIISLMEDMPGKSKYPLLFFRDMDTAVNTMQDIGTSEDTSVNEDSRGQRDINLAGNTREAIVLCNPGAPDARLRNLDFLVDHCKRYGKYLIVDESFMDFCEDYCDYSAFRYDYRGIIIIKSLTKIYGIPGLRLGYMASRDRSIIDKIRGIQEPWSVNSLAQAGAMAVLEDLDFLEKTRKSYKYERDYLETELSKIDAIDVYPSDSAYILCSLNERSKYRTAHDLKMDMVETSSILIRDASSFVGLTPRHFRLAVKSHDLNQRLVCALRDKL